MGKFARAVPLWSIVRLGECLVQWSEIWFSYIFGGKCFDVLKDAYNGRFVDIPSDVATAIYHVNDVLVKVWIGV